jgi:hypothetical protein
MITLKREQEQVLMEAVNSGLAETANEALDQALEALKNRLPCKGSPDESVAAAADIWQTSRSVVGRDDD